MDKGEQNVLLLTYMDEKNNILDIQIIMQGQIRGGGGGVFGG